MESQTASVDSRQKCEKMNYTFSVPRLHHPRSKSAYEFFFFCGKYAGCFLHKFTKPAAVVPALERA
jgi:hypothetical protein